MDFKKILLILVVILTIVSTHEMGHLLASRELGLNVNNLSIGWKIPYLNTLSLQFKINDISVSVNPILLGGYTNITPEEYNKLNFTQKTIVNVAGVAVNFITGILILFVMGIRNKIKFSQALKKSLYFPVSLLQLEDIQKAAMDNEYIKTLTSNLPDKGFSMDMALLNIAVYSVILGIVNLLPIFPLDGGWVMYDVIISLLTAEEAKSLIFSISVINLIIIDKRKSIVRILKKGIK